MIYASHYMSEWTPVLSLCEMPIWRGVCARLRISFSEAKAKDYRRGAESAEKGENINTEDTEKSGEHRERGARGDSIRLDF
jgi:hypothetical protein